MTERPQPYVRQTYMCVLDRNGQSVSCRYSRSEEIAEALERVAGA